MLKKIIIGSLVIFISIMAYFSWKHTIEVDSMDVNQTLISDTYTFHIYQLQHRKYKKEDFYPKVPSWLEADWVPHKLLLFSLRVSYFFDDLYNKDQHTLVIRGVTTEKEKSEVLDRDHTHLKINGKSYRLKKSISTGAIIELQFFIPNEPINTLTLTSQSNQLSFDPSRWKQYRLFDRAAVPLFAREKFSFSNSLGYPWFASGIERLNDHQYQLHYYNVKNDKEQKVINEWNQQKKQWIEAK